MDSFTSFASWLGIEWLTLPSNIHAEKGSNSLILFLILSCSLQNTLDEKHCVPSAWRCVWWTVLSPGVVLYRRGSPHLWRPLSPNPPCTGNNILMGQLGLYPSLSQHTPSSYCLTPTCVFYRIARGSTLLPGLPSKVLEEPFLGGLGSTAARGQLCGSTSVIRLTSLI